LSPTVIRKTYEYHMIYVHTSFHSLSHFSGETQEKNRPNTFRGKLLSAHDIIYISRPAPRASGIANSHEPRTRHREKERDGGVSPIFHLSVKMDVPCEIHPTRRRRREIGGTRRCGIDDRGGLARRSPDPSMRKIGVRAHEWAPAVNKVAALV